MYAIARHERGSALGVARTEITNHRNVFLWLEGTLPEQDADGVFRVISDLRAKRLYLACRCTNDRADPPLFTPVATGHGGLTLRRLTDRGPHGSNCPLAFVEPPKGIAGGDAGGPSKNIEPKSPPDFLEHIQGSHLAGSRSDTDTQAKSRSNKRQIALARQLFWLLGKSGMQNFPLQGCITPVGRILEVAKATNLKGGARLSDVLFCKAEAWTHSWMDSAFARCDNLGLERQAILICPVFDASRAESWVRMRPDGPREPIAGSVSIYGDDKSPARYPMLMIAKILARGERQPEIVKAYMHPVVSESNWLLVDSDYERHALRVLSETCAELAAENIHCEIHKPLYDWLETGARPDFVLTAIAYGRQKTMVVETMGSVDPEYIARKRETVTKLNDYFVFRDLRYMRDSGVDQRLRDAVLGFFRSRN